MQNVHLDLSYLILYNPIRINKLAFLSLSINPHLGDAGSLCGVRRRGESLAIPKEQIRKTMDLLTTWNPLGDRAMTIGDLENYRTEAIDILFHLRLAGPNANPGRIVQDVMNQAFVLSLSLQECTDIGREIQAFIR